MEIVGIGTEIVECLRIRRMIEKHADAFLRHVFTDAEIRTCQARRHPTEAFASVWAAKEAVLKSLGLPGRRGVSWTEIEVENPADAAPTLSLGGRCAELMRERQIARVLVTTSQCRAYATAYAVAVRGGPAARAD